MGIIGTFFGISSGLASYAVGLGSKKGDSSADAEALKNATIEFLSYHVGPAFKASLVAVSCAVIFLFIERLAFSLTTRDLEAFHRALDALFPRATEEDLLERLLGQSKEQTTYLKHFNLDLSTAFEKASDALEGAIQLMLQQQAREIQQANATLVNGISTSLTSTLDPVTTELKNTIDVMRREQNQATETTLNDLVERFASSFQGAAHGQLATLGQALEGTVQAINDMQRNFRLFIDQLGAQGRDQNESMARDLKELLGEIKFTTSSLRESTQGNMQDLTDRIQQTLGSFTESIGGVQAALERNVRESDARQEQLNKRLQEQLEESQSKLNQLITSMGDLARNGTQQMAVAQQQAIEGLQKSLGEQANQSLAAISGTVSQELDKIACSLTTLVGESTTTNAELRKSFKELGLMVGDLTVKTSNTTGNLAKTLDGASGQMATLASQLASMSTSLAAQLKAFQELTGEMQKGADGLVNSGRNVAESAKNSKEAALAMQNLISALTSQSDVARKSSAELQSVAASFTSATQSHMEAIKNLGAMHNDLVTQVEEDMRRYHSTASQSLSTYLSQVDGALSKAGSTIHAATTALEDAVSELAIVMSRGK